MAEAGWLSDPNGRHELRYWDGVQWTDHVSNDGEKSTDPYDPDVVPPPPSAELRPIFEYEGPASQEVPSSQPSQSSQQTEPSYRLVLYDKWKKPVYDSPYTNADMAIEFAQRNAHVELPRSVGSVLLRGALKPNVVRWRRAVVWKVDRDTGDLTEYHSMEQSLY